MLLQTKQELLPDDAAHAKIETASPDRCLGAAADPYMDCVLTVSPIKPSGTTAIARTGNAKDMASQNKSPVMDKTSLV